MQKFPVALIAIVFVAIGIGIYVITTTSGNDSQKSTVNQVACAADETYTNTLDAAIHGKLQP